MQKLGIGRGDLGITGDTFQFKGCFKKLFFSDAVSAANNFSILQIQIMLG
jgi:hypothetical protein